MTHKEFFISLVNSNLQNLAEEDFVINNKNHIVAVDEMYCILGFWTSKYFDSADQENKHDANVNKKAKNRKWKS